ncbi:MAG: hypothetical protein EXS32_13650 [Opitutus sp.]|nr:hypothetical protein [Opitutus sp.]
MKRLFPLFLLAATCLHAQSGAVDLGGHGKLALYIDDGWTIEVADYGDRRLVTVSPKGDVNASCTITITFPQADRLENKSRLKQRTEIDGTKYADGSVEGKAISREFTLTAGYGFYCNFTDPALIGKPPVKGDYKTMSVGLIHLAADVLLEVAISADGFKSAPYQSLLGMIEGMEFTPPRAGRN